MSNSTMPLQHLSSLLQCCQAAVVSWHIRGCNFLTWKRGFRKDWVASDATCVTQKGSWCMQAAEASQMKDWFDRVYPNKKRYLIGLRSMAWDKKSRVPVVSSMGRSVFGNFGRNYQVRLGSWNSLVILCNTMLCTNHFNSPSSLTVVKQAFILRLQWTLKWSKTATYFFKIAISPQVLLKYVLHAFKDHHH